MSSRILVDEIQNKAGTVSVAPTALIKEIDMWIVSTNPEPTGSTDHNPITGWERRTLFFTKTGTGLTYNSSNGSFALPSAGTWRIYYKFDTHHDSDDVAMNLDLDASDNGGTSFAPTTDLRIMRHQEGKDVAGNDTRTVFSGTVTFTVTTSQLSNFRFRWRLAGTPTDLVIQTQTNSAMLRTHFTIERIAD